MRARGQRLSQAPPPVALSLAACPHPQGGAAGPAVGAQDGAAGKVRARAAGAERGGAQGVHLSAAHGPAAQPRKGAAGRPRARAALRAAAHLGAAQVRWCLRGERRPRWRWQGRAALCLQAGLPTARAREGCLCRRDLQGDGGAEEEARGRWASRGGAWWSASQASHPGGAGAGAAGAVHLQAAGDRGAPGGGHRLCQAPPQPARLPPAFAHASARSC